LKALQLYQNLIDFHATKNNDIALAAVDVERLLFVYNNGRIAAKEAVYLSALKNGKNKVTDAYAKALYDFEIAQHTYNQGQNYTAEENENLRWANKEALEICEQIITAFPSTIAASKAQNLKATIVNPVLSLQLESYLPIATASRMLVSYSNTSSVILSVYSISEKESAALQKIYDKEKKRRFIEKLKLEKRWTQQLRDEGDYRRHATEVLLSGYAQGRYLVMATPPNEDDKRLFDQVEIQYTNLAIVQTQDSGQTFFQIVDRDNGTPISNAKCVVKDERRNGGSNTYVTDSKGFIKIPKANKQYYNFSITVTKGSDTAKFNNYYSNNRNYDNGDSNPYRSFLFTDRSIYRPGQTLYLKGIVTKTENENSEVVPYQNVTIKLIDANYEDVSEVQLKTNDFGTVASEFVLPNGVLTGQCQLIIEAS
jgi:hypothetical protein